MFLKLWASTGQFLPCNIKLRIIRRAHRAFIELEPGLLDGIPGTRLFCPAGRLPVDDHVQPATVLRIPIFEVMPVMKPVPFLHFFIREYKA